MKAQAKQNNEFHRIGSKVLNAVRLTDEEIDNIVAAPHLFSSIRSTIKTELAAVEPVRSNEWTRFWPKRFAFAALALLLVTAGIGITHSLLPTEPTVVTNILPIAIEEKQPEFTKEIEPVDTVRTSTRFATSPKRPVAARTITQKAQEKEPDMGEFQILAYIGDDDGQGERIVRVELPRASLYALGIEIPAENETAKIKTDLLIGSDGVMKAVRVAQN